MKLTRRQLAAVVSATAMIAKAQQSAAPAPPADEMQAARDRMKANSDALARVDVPAEVEPAFRFHA